jgi:hypothetical protein
MGRVGRGEGDLKIWKKSVFFWFLQEIGDVKVEDGLKKF